MKRRSGFTLIEILVVIGIIMVLVGIVFFGMSRVSTTARNREVTVTLGNLRGMVTELDAKAGLTGKQPTHQWIGGTVNTTGPFNFWKDGDPTTDLPPVGDDPIIQPGVVESLPAREQSAAVRNTQVAMVLLTSIPANKTMLASFPTQHTMKLPNINNPAGYDASLVPVPVDPWNNPIIFVPGGGLCGDGTNPMYVGGKAGDPDAKEVVASPATGQLGPIRSPDGRPFWASAGPDGDFGKADDNVYSFE